VSHLLPIAHVVGLGQVGHLFDAWDRDLRLCRGRGGGRAEGKGSKVDGKEWAHGLQGLGPRLGVDFSSLKCAGIIHESLWCGLQVLDLLKVEHTRGPHEWRRVHRLCWFAQGLVHRALRVEIGSAFAVHIQCWCVGTRTLRGPRQ
jgi:hypothetical protein